MRNIAMGLSLIVLAGPAAAGGLLEDLSQASRELTRSVRGAVEKLKDRPHRPAKAESGPASAAAPKVAFTVERAKELILAGRASYEVMFGWMVGEPDGDGLEWWSIPEEQCGAFIQAAAELEAAKTRAPK
ncbi:MAG: hypothetical protein HY554_13180 [Elusimicrobia bacterium]|nr:hypothetical protein [Elusimicrobiota bacterium]